MKNLRVLIAATAAVGVTFGLFLLMYKLISSGGDQHAELDAIAEKIDDDVETLRAAVDPEARGGEYYGPGGRMEQTGHPVRVDSNQRSKNLDDARRLWDVSVELTHADYSVLDPSTDH